MDFVDEDKLRAFAAKVQEMANEEFGFDDCGGNTVDVHVNDRSRHWRIRWFPIPYEHKATSMEELEKCFDRYLTNLGIATDEMDKFLRTRQYEVKRINKLIDARKDMLGEFGGMPSISGE